MNIQTTDIVWCINFLLNVQNNLHTWLHLHCSRWSHLCYCWFYWSSSLLMHNFKCALVFVLVASTDLTRLVTQVFVTHSIILLLIFNLKIFHSFSIAVFLYFKINEIFSPFISLWEVYSLFHIQFLKSLHDKTLIQNLW